MEENQEKHQDTTIIKLNKVLLKSEREELNRKRKTKAFFVLSFLVVFAIGVVVGFGFNNKKIANINSNTQDEIIEALNSYWLYGDHYKDLSTVLKDKALKGMTTFTDDPYTTYFSKEEALEFNQNVSMNVTGIGVGLNEDVNKDVFITKVYDKSPAKKAGLIAGDIFYAVNDQKVAGIGIEALKNLVIGSENTTVEIKVKRNEAIKSFSIKREKIDFSAFGEKRGNYYYLNINSFGEETDLRVSEYLNDMKNEGLSNLIIDLRDNGGGYLTAVTKILGLFLDQDATCLIEEYKDGSQKVDKVQGSKMDHIKKIVLLQNQSSASASEVFIMALREQFPNLTTVGTTTYGKGVIQGQYELSDGSVLKLTTSKWLSSKGVWINGKGINPDHQVNRPLFFDFEFKAMNDNESLELGDSDNRVGSIRLGLEFLGYHTEAYGTYFDESLVQAIKNYEGDNNLKTTGIISRKLQQNIVTSANRLYNNDYQNHDPQMKEAIKLINE